MQVDFVDYNLTRSNIGDDTLDSDADADGRIFISVDGSGMTVLDYDIGLTRRGSIGDYVFEDLRRNGRQDAGDSGLGGVKVYLVKDAVRIDSTVSSNTGFY